MCAVVDFLKSYPEGDPSLSDSTSKVLVLATETFFEVENAFSDVFFITNCIRKGYILSPRLYSIYVDQLNLLFSDSKIRCHIRRKPLNNFSYVDS